MQELVPLFDMMTALGDAYKVSQFMNVVVDPQKNVTNTSRTSWNVQFHANYTAVAGSIVPIDTFIPANFVDLKAALAACDWWACFGLVNQNAASPTNQCHMVYENGSSLFTQTSGRNSNTQNLNVNAPPSAFTHLQFTNNGVNQFNFSLQIITFKQ